MVFRSTARPAADFVRMLREEGLAVNATSPETVRAVAHLDVSMEDIDRAAEIVAKVAGR